MKSSKIILIILCTILVFIVYNLYKTSNDDNYKNIENFSILKGLNNKKKKNNNSNTNSDDNDNDNNDKLDFKNSLRKLKSKKTGTTFDDLFKATEDMDPEKISFENMKNDLFKYNNSFKKEKFKNNSKNTAESFEKFNLYKEKFFEIFK